MTGQRSQLIVDQNCSFLTSTGLGPERGVIKASCHPLQSHPSSVSATWIQTLKSPFGCKTSSQSPRKVTQRWTLVPRSNQANRSVKGPTREGPEDRWRQRRRMACRPEHRVQRHRELCDLGKVTPQGLSFAICRTGVTFYLLGMMRGSIPFVQSNTRHKPTGFTTATPSLPTAF